MFPAPAQAPSPAQTGHMDICYGTVASCGTCSMANSNPQGKAMPEAQDTVESSQVSGPSGRCGQHTLGTSLAKRLSDEWLTTGHCVLVRACRPAEAPLWPLPKGQAKLTAGSLVPPCPGTNW